MTTSRLMDEMYEVILPEMAANNIEDTTENRIAFLQGLFDAWSEDPETSYGKSMHMCILNEEIFRLQLTSVLDRIDALS